MKRPLERESGGSLPLAEMDPKAWEKLPNLRAFLLSTAYEGEGGERLPGSVILRADSNRWTLSLKEPTSCKQLFLAAPTLNDLWRLADAAIGDESTPWVDDTWALARRPKAGRRKP